MIRIPAIKACRLPGTLSNSNLDPKKFLEVDGMRSIGRQALRNPTSTDASTYIMI